MSPSPASPCRVCAWSSTADSHASRGSIRTAASRDWMSWRFHRHRPTSARGAPVASPTVSPIAFGRNRSDWNRNAARKSRRSTSRRWRWSSRPGAAPHCASSIRRHQARLRQGATCCIDSMRSICVARSPHADDACSRWARIRGSPRCCSHRAIRAASHWPATLPPWSKRAIRYVRVRMRWRNAGTHWPHFAPVAFRTMRIVPRSRPSMPRRSNGAVACVAMRRRRQMRRRTNSATCSHTRFRIVSPGNIRAMPSATNSPTAACCACSTIPRCMVNRGSSPANCASKPGTRCCCVAHQSTRRCCAMNSPRISAKATKCAGTRKSVRW